MHSFALSIKLSLTWFMSFLAFTLLILFPYHWERVEEDRVGMSCGILYRWKSFLSVCFRRMSLARSSSRVERQKDKVNCNVLDGLQKKWWDWGKMFSDRITIPWWKAGISFYYYFLSPTIRQVGNCVLKVKQELLFLCKDSDVRSFCFHCVFKVCTSEGFDCAKLSCY